MSKRSTMVQADVRRDGAVHLCPRAGSLVAACCGLGVLELPENDRITEDALQVTCGR
ncbi:hypothetical protein AA0Z99_03995 [Agrococcus sp. 1P02AA]|uniref:hypothetical protein n=1 Tax=Agrococcus sp. 1P02AA TaxID=3132259 RepID=UPI0039A717EA